jgi:hypothetical protein
MHGRMEPQAKRRVIPVIYRVEQEDEHTCVLICIVPGPILWKNGRESG